MPPIHDLLQHLQVNVIEARYTQCWPEWRDTDYIPAYNRLYLIMEGEGWLKVGGREFYPLPGELCLMPAHVLQSYSAINGGQRPFLKYWCHFTAAIGQLELFDCFDVPYCVEASRAGRFVPLFMELTELYQERSVTARIREKAVLLEIIALLLENGAVRVSSSQNADMERLGKIRRYIEEHMQEPITVGEIARHIHLHPNYFIKYFKKHFSVSPLKYVNQLKMGQAKLLLQTTALSVKEVAARTGFDDTNHFSKSFHRETGFSPTEYRSRVLQLPEGAEQG